MIYFKTKKELELLEGFRNDVIEFWELKNTLGISDDSQVIGPYQKAMQHAQMESVRSHLKDDFENYQFKREEISKNLPKIVKISRKLRVSSDVTSLPAPAVGGFTIPQNIFMAIISDNTHGGIERQTILDTINMTLGQCERLVGEEFYKLINPFYWLLAFIKLIVRIPFLLLQTSGFDVRKIEETFVAKSFKLVTLIVYFLLAIYFGQKANVLELLKTLVK